MNSNNTNKYAGIPGYEDVTSTKVTVGFKCDPQVKLKLSRNAMALGLTISQYLENIIVNMENVQKEHETEVNDLKRTIAFYENPILLSLFNEYQGQTVNLTTADGGAMQIQIKSLSDIYIIIINSFRKGNHD